LGLELVRAPRRFARDGVEQARRPVRRRREGPSSIGQILGDEALDAALGARRDGVEQLGSRLGRRRVGPGLRV
jgi:hypothetical protein